MMKVTQMREPANRPGFLKVYVDDDEVGLVSLNDVSELGLIIGNDIDMDKFESLVKKVKDLEHYFLAVRYTDRRLRSEAEVRRYLLSKGCDFEVASKIVAKLTKAGLIDEAKLAEAYVHDAGLAKPLSKKVIKLKLRQKGLSERAINAGMDSAEMDDTQALDALIERKSRQSSYANNQPKFFRYLLTQGFSFEDIAARIGKPQLSSSSHRSGNRTGLK